MDQNAIALALLNLILVAHEQARLGRVLRDDEAHAIQTTTDGFDWCSPADARWDTRCDLMEKGFLHCARQILDTWAPS